MVRNRIEVQASTLGVALCLAITHQDGVDAKQRRHCAITHLHTENSRGTSEPYDLCPRNMLSRSSSFPDVYVIGGLFVGNQLPRPVLFSGSWVRSPTNLTDSK
jgi:hypothetical protein